MAKTDEVVSAKMIPVVQGIVDWIEAHIFDTLSVSAIAKKVRLLTLVLPATIRHGNGLHAGELRQPTKDDDCDNLFNADAGVDTEYFSVPGIRGTSRFLPDLSPSLWHVADPLSS
ncbi:Regulatory protein soxS [Klebsiella pneumoniae IS43]|uniref:Regulatory protein n=2 Tax=Klebsiella pneumoniae TaxID=573 RepID=A0A378A590_KLEPN|nr:Regulatory protein soxS [Klebsiella pneumoniae IS43]STU96389.1 regulatory protein [Klebsiella pneumoniae]